MKRIAGLFFHLNFVQQLPGNPGKAASLPATIQRSCEMCLSRFFNFRYEDPTLLCIPLLSGSAEQW